MYLLYQKHRLRASPPSLPPLSLRGHAVPAAIRSLPRHCEPRSRRGNPYPPPSLPPGGILPKRRLVDRNFTSLAAVCDTTARPFRSVSSPHRKRFAGLRRGPHFRILLGMTKPAISDAFPTVGAGLCPRPHPSLRAAAPPRQSAANREGTEALPYGISAPQPTVGAGLRARPIRHCEGRSRRDDPSSIPPIRNKTVSCSVTLCNLFPPIPPGNPWSFRLFSRSICRKMRRNLTNRSPSAILPVSFQSVTKSYILVSAGCRQRSPSRRNNETRRL